MTRKISLIIAIMLFTISIAAVGHSGEALDSKSEYNSAPSTIYEPDTLTGESAIYTGEERGGSDGNSNGVQWPYNLTQSTSVAVVSYDDSISKRSARTGRNPQTGKSETSGDSSDVAIANRLLASVKASNCPIDGDEKCIIDAVRNSEIYGNLSEEEAAEIKITMDLKMAADPIIAANSTGSGDCDDENPGARPGVCSSIYSVDPDFDGDGFPDLTVEGSAASLTGR